MLLKKSLSRVLQGDEALSSLGQLPGCQTLASFVKGFAGHPPFISYEGPGDEDFFEN